MTTSNWMVYDLFCYGGFRQDTFLGDATVSGCPSCLMEKVHFHHWYTTHGNHQQRLEACGVETVSRSPQTPTHIDISNIMETEDIQCANNSVCCAAGCECVHHLFLKCFLMCVWFMLLLLSLWQLNHQMSSSYFPQSYGPVPVTWAAICVL